MVVREKELLTKKVTVRFTEKEYKKLEKIAKRNKLKVPQCVRGMLF